MSTDPAKTFDRNKEEEVSLKFYNTMKRFLIIGLVFVLLALDWAALDDITTGNEPDYFLEYMILGVSLLIFGLIGLAAVFGKKSRNNI